MGKQKAVYRCIQLGFERYTEPRRCVSASRRRHCCPHHHCQQYRHHSGGPPVWSR
ncbi:hypothetical protein F441_12201 [Phytophthora nicotianae CJ01A1]|uniref:Uncharacterized protein n=5 Tax=Phytophthora nicotianae TaxID=4792 RepID=W2Q0E6_PHYN3|nr:hypothetical protein PPTG_23396 [Phytophthora nicotianae INRA-310]ETI42665.1 hypothetical protein F443_12222 [Phytophthora nicotianae P1569]ETO71289.1 hypothetical protein F444_12324 [Phytophthora nicotianae P1976]ETP12401.1 hypothetical protein F441_12201 [Phytophthora nicotianae CJ01A1]ETP40520.1 hypothetical protein F442_12132 [Phytophthora nicotianae P10297]ETN05999.1 hypothetical protein PPTG_23396 [Phytophthora nicotianae INRA-310]